MSTITQPNDPGTTLVGPWTTLQLPEGRLILRLEQKDEGSGTITIRFFPSDGEEESWIGFSDSFDSRDIGRHTKAIDHFNDLTQFIIDHSNIMDWEAGFLQKLPSGILQLFLQDEGGYILTGGIESQDDKKKTVLELRMSISHHQYELARLLHALNAISCSYLLDVGSSLLDTYEPLPHFHENFKTMFEKLDSDTIERLKITDAHLRQEFEMAKNRMIKVHHISQEFH